MKRFAICTYWDSYEIDGLAFQALNTIAVIPQHCTKYCRSQAIHGLTFEDFKPD